ncbi:MAG: TonB-dependent siderophore receptor [Halomonadaceae bacterium]|jgi:iron complex outermembrane receptor protein
MHQPPLRRPLLTIAIAAACGTVLAPFPSIALAQNASADDTETGQQLDTVTIYGTLPSRYEGRYADTALRIPKDIAEVPRTIDVIPEQFLLDQQAREMADAFRLSPNMVVGDGYGGSREHTLIRGFNRNDNIYRNGVPSGNASRVDPATIDNVQIIKGPVADIGRMSPGGIVNIETKQPQFQREHSVSTTFDEHGQRRGVFDLTGPVGNSQNLAYRITGAAEDSDTFRDTTVDRQFLSSSLLWQGDSGVRIGVNHEYTRDRRDIDRGLITVPTGDSRREIADVPFDTRYDANIPNERDSKAHLVELNVTIPLVNPAWEIDNKLFYSRETSEDIKAEVASVGPDSGLPDDVLARRVINNRDQEIVHRFARSQLIGEIDTAIPMRLATGVEYREYNQEWKNFSGNIQAGGTVSNPDSFSLVNDIGTPSRAQFSDASIKSYGVFSATEFSLTDTLTLDLGLRYERFENDYHNENLLTGVTTDLDSGRMNKLTKGLGLVWETTPGLNLYISYADTFEPQNIFFGDQRVIEQNPSEGRQVEAGMKWRSADNRYFITGAIFDIREDNVVEFVNGEPVPTGGITSKGAEVSVAANPIDGFNVRGGVGVLDAEIDSDNDATDGNRPRNVPKTTASLWASYEFQNPESALRGLGIGSGITYASNRYGDNTHSFELGDYTILDTGLWYYLPVGNGNRLRFDLGVKNVTDEEYIVASGGNTRISVGNPRTFFGGIRFEF